MLWLMSLTYLVFWMVNGLWVPRFYPADATMFVSWPYKVSGFLMLFWMCCNVPSQMFQTFSASRRIRRGAPALTAAVTL
jgi:hypothetical protein